VIIAEKSEFIAIRSTDFAEVGDVRAFRTAGPGRLEIEPAGNMTMPSCRVVNRPDGDYRIHQGMFAPADGKFPKQISFPRMMISTVENAYCLPFGPPVLPTIGRIVTDYLVPWAPQALGWFSYIGNDHYTANATIDTNDVEYDIETAFYLDHSISGHFGHFIADCMSRMYAWDVCRAIFGDVKVIVAHGVQTDFQTHLKDSGLP
jgi:hypothetical protein